MPMSPKSFSKSQANTIWAFEKSVIKNRERTIKGAIKTCADQLQKWKVKFRIKIAATVTEPEFQTTIYNNISSLN